MSNINYIQGNILKAAKRSRILIHSCNCNGSWGGGIAYQLATHYPIAEDIYMRICKQYGDKLLGKCVLIPSYEEEDFVIGCLFTSSLGGSTHDSSSDILKYTKMALEQLSMMISKNDLLIDKDIEHTTEAISGDIRKPLSKYTLEMPKINSGIFDVPWEETESVLKKLNGSLEFTVYSL